MKKNSIWKNYLSKENKNKIAQDYDVDVLIVGGGMTGLSTLYQLKQSNLNVILVERNTCGDGVTSRSTAKITYLQGDILNNIRNLVGYEKAGLYLKSQIEAVNILKDIINKEQIECDFKEVDSYLFTNQDKNISKIEEEYKFLKDNGIKAKYVNDLGIDTKKCLKVNNTYVFNPSKYLNYIKDKYKDCIYENSKAGVIEKDKDGYICQVNGFNIRAKDIVIATHYPYFIFPFMVPFKTHIETSYLGAIKVNEFKNISAINIDKPCISFRYHTDGTNNYLIYLYNSLRSSGVKCINEHFEDLNKKGNFDYVWSNKDIISNDYMPYIGEIKKHFYIASGFNTWGFTNGTLASLIISDKILNKKNEYADLVSSHRDLNMSKLIRFPLDVGCTIKSIIKSNKENVNNSQVIYKKIDGKNVAIYLDENGLEHIVYNRCPHMKCGIIFNETEKTWDCLCHGSRFDIDGKCIEGPSNYDISFK